MPEPKSSKKKRKSTSSSSNDEEALTKRFDDAMIQCLNSAQKTLAHHPQLVTQMCELYKQNEAIFTARLAVKIKHVLTLEKLIPSSERIISFVSELANEITKKENEGAPDSRDQTIKFKLHFIKILAPLSNCEDKTVRWRVTQIVSELLVSIPTSISVDDEEQEILQSIIEAFQDRLHDRIYAVRVFSVALFARLQTPEEGLKNDTILKRYVHLMKYDQYAAVRKAVVEHIALSKDTIPDFIQRIHDIDESVRVAVYKQIGKNLKLRSLTIAQRVAILTTGLKDRSPYVREAAFSLLFDKWLKQLDYDPLQLLSALDVEGYKKYCESILEIIFDQYDMALGDELKRIQAQGNNEEENVEKPNIEEPDEESASESDEDEQKSSKTKGNDKKEPKKLFLSKRNARILMEKAEKGISAALVAARQETASSGVSQHLTEGAVFFWRCKVERYKELETEKEGFPTLSEFCRIFSDSHLSGKCFITSELLSMAQYFDKTDEVGRRTTKVIVQLMLSTFADPEIYCKELIILLKSLCNSDDEFYDILQEKIEEMRVRVKTCEAYREDTEIILAKAADIKNDREQKESQKNSLMRELKELKDVHEYEEKEEEEEEDLEENEKEEKEEKKKVRTDKLRQFALQIQMLEKDIEVLTVKLDELSTEFDNKDGSLFVVRCLCLIYNFFTQTTPHDMTQFQYLLKDLVIPNLTSKDGYIRESSFKVFGLFCCSKLEVAQEMFWDLGIEPLLKKECEITVVRVILKGIFDVFAIHGVENVFPIKRQQIRKDSQEELSENVEELEKLEKNEIEKKIRLVFKILIELLHFSEDESIRRIVAEGFTKLCTSPAFETTFGSINLKEMVFSNLVISYFNPLTENDLVLRQCLSLFFPTFAYSSLRNFKFVSTTVVDCLQEVEIFLDRTKKSPNSKARSKKPSSRDSNPKTFEDLFGESSSFLADLHKSKFSISISLDITQLSKFLLNLTDPMKFKQQREADLFQKLQNPNILLPKFMSHETIAKNLSYQILHDPNHKNVNKSHIKLFELLTIYKENTSELKKLIILCEKLENANKTTTFFKKIDKFKENCESLLKSNPSFIELGETEKEEEKKQIEEQINEERKKFNSEKSKLIKFVNNEDLLEQNEEEQEEEIVEEEQENPKKRKRNPKSKSSKSKNKDVYVEQEFVDDGEETPEEEIAQQTSEEEKSFDISMLQPENEVENPEESEKIVRKKSSREKEKTDSEEDEDLELQPPTKKHVIEKTTTISSKDDKNVSSSSKNDKNASNSSKNDKNASSSSKNDKNLAQTNKNTSNSSKNDKENGKKSQKIVEIVDDDDPQEEQPKSTKSKISISSSDDEESDDLEELISDVDKDSDDNRAASSSKLKSKSSKLSNSSKKKKKDSGENEEELDKQIDSLITELD